jgi:hypothetical protein
MSGAQVRRPPWTRYELCNKPLAAIVGGLVISIGIAAFKTLSATPLDTGVRCEWSRRYLAGLGYATCPHCGRPSVEHDP